MKEKEKERKDHGKSQNDKSILIFLINIHFCTFITLQSWLCQLPSNAWNVFFYIYFLQCVTWLQRYIIYHLLLTIPLPIASSSLLSNLTLTMTSILILSLRSHASSIVTLIKLFIINTRPLTHLVRVLSLFVAAPLSMFCRWRFFFFTFDPTR